LPKAVCFIHIVWMVSSMNISRRSFSILIITNCATLACLGFLALTGFAKQDHFTELTAERINIVSPTGKNVIAISNKERIAAPVMGGKSYPVSVSEGRSLMAGMVFFNQDGDEMGGLLFNSFKQPNGKVAGIGHLSFDRFNDNQVMSLEYNENSRKVQSGLTLYDRPATGSFKESLDLIQEAQKASPMRLAEIKTRFGEMSKKGELGAERVFVGSLNQEAQLVLKDTK
jgi:hypothetical protein